MKTIWKFELTRLQLCHIRMPVGAKIVRLARQGESICMWAVVEPTNDLEERKFTTVGTGQPIPKVSRYVGTWDDPPFVWHLFELGKIHEQ